MNPPVKNDLHHGLFILIVYCKSTRAPDIKRGFVRTLITQPYHDALSNDGAYKSPFLLIYDYVVYAYDGPSGKLKNSPLEDPRFVVTNISMFPSVLQIGILGIGNL